MKVEVATVDKSLLNLISSGFKNLSSLTGHKTYRWLVRSGFENVIKGVEDARLIRTSGGFDGISKMIGCNSKDDPQRIKRILYTLDHGYFELPNGTRGSLISIVYS